MNPINLCILLLRVIQIMRNLLLSIIWNHVIYAIIRYVESCDTWNHVICGVMWSHVESCGVMWSHVLCGII